MWEERIDVQRGGPARPGTARWGSGQHDTSCLPGLAKAGTVPDLRLRHGLLGRLSGRVGPRSTVSPACRASPGPR